MHFSLTKINGMDAFTKIFSLRKTSTLFSKLPCKLEVMVLVATALLFVGPVAAFPQTPRPVFDVITVDSPITPPIARYILDNLGAAEREGATGLIIMLDTPGGLDTSMRDITKGILNAAVPVIVYVYPSGARAASAGVIITAAAHIAAMAPGTNIGAAHPVSIGLGGMDKTMERKVENDAAAYVRSIAEQRGRNADWLEKAVRKSESITAEDALHHRVIDFVATDVGNLLEQADNMKLLVSPHKLKVTLHTRGAVINEKTMGLRQGILAAISNPNIAYILLLVGLAGLYFEFTTPGALLPGIIGGISLLLSFFAMQTLPVNYVGVLLMLFSVVLFFAEVMVISHGLLTVGGIISLVLGSLMLFDSPDPALRISLQVLIPAVATISIFFLAVIGLVVKAQRRKQYIGEIAIIGEEGETVTDVHEEGQVFVKGEYWRAESEQRVDKGRKIVVVGIKGMKLIVREQ